MKRIAFLFQLIAALVASSSCASSAAEPKELFIQTDHAKLFCRSMGKGSPVIVLHGGPGLSQDYLQPALNKLAENHFVIFYDQRGSGKSEGEIDPKYINLPVFVNDLETVRQHFGLKKVSVLGHSWGGFLAMQYAIAHPEAVDKLILLSSMPNSSEDFALFREEYSRRITPFQKELEHIQTSQEFLAGDPVAVANFFKILFRTYCAIPEKADGLNLLASPQANLNFRKTNDIFHKTLFSQPFSLEEELKKIPCKTLIVHGDYDPIPLSSMETVHKCMNHSTFVVIEGCGHFPYIEKPRECFEALEDFLTGD